MWNVQFKGVIDQWPAEYQQFLEQAEVILHIQASKHGPAYSEDMNGWPFYEACGGDEEILIFWQLFTQLKWQVNIFTSNRMQLISDIILVCESSRNLKDI